MLNMLQNKVIQTHGYLVLIVSLLATALPWMPMIIPLWQQYH